MLLVFNFLSPYKLQRNKYNASIVKNEALKINGYNRYLIGMKVYGLDVAIKGCQGSRE